MSQNATAAADAGCTICRHIKTNGRRCQSPALVNSALCFYHRALRRSHRSTARTALEAGPLRPETVEYFLKSGLDPAEIARPHAPIPALNLPPLEDPEAIQLAISVLFSAIVAGQVDPTRARILLYALQLASYNVRALVPAPPLDDDADDLVRSVVRTRQGESLAAPGDNNGAPAPSDRPKSMTDRFIADFGCSPSEVYARRNPRE